MREEVEAAINEEGWTKAAMGKLKKVDSFMKESLRLYATAACTFRRFFAF